MVTACLPHGLTQGHHKALPDIKFNSCFAMVMHQMQPSLLLAHFPLPHCDHRRGPARHHSKAVVPWPCTKETLPSSLRSSHLQHCDQERALHHPTCQTRALYEAGADVTVPCLLPCALQGGGVPARKGKRATRQPGKPENRAMATRFYHNVLILLHWQAQLLDALVQVK
jgi:hypothetical protein